MKNEKHEKVESWTLFAIEGLHVLQNYFKIFSYISFSKSQRFEWEKIRFKMWDKSALGIC